MIDPLIEKEIRNSDDQQLLMMLSKPDEYLPEALVVAHDEIQKRGGLEAIKALIHKQAEIDLKIEESKFEDIPISEYRYPKMWIGVVLTILAFLIIVFAVGEDLSPDKSSGFIEVASLILVIAYIYWLICIWKLHGILRQHTKGKYPITPAQAVGYGLTPFYNLYWMFKWTNQIIDFVNHTKTKKLPKNWSGFWLLFSFLLWAASSALSCLLKFIIGIRLMKQIRIAIEKQPS